MNQTFTLEEIINFSEAEIEQFIDDYIQNGEDFYSPGHQVIQNIMNFSGAYHSPITSNNYPGVINN